MTFNALTLYNVRNTSNFHNVHRVDNADSDSDDSSSYTDTDATLSEADFSGNHTILRNESPAVIYSPGSPSIEDFPHNHVLEGIVVELKSTAAEETIKALITCLRELLSISESTSYPTSALNRAVEAVRVDVEKAAGELVGISNAGQNVAVSIEDPFRWLVMKMIEIIADHTNGAMIELEFEDSDHQLPRASAQRLEDARKTFNEIWNSKRTSALAQIRRLEEDEESRRKEQQKRRREEMKDHRLAMRLQAEERMIHEAEQVEAQALRQRERVQRRAQRQRHQVRVSTEMRVSPETRIVTMDAFAQTRPTNPGRQYYGTGNTTLFNVSNSFNTRQYSYYK